MTADPSACTARGWFNRRDPRRGRMVSLALVAALGLLAGCSAEVRLDDAIAAAGGDTVPVPVADAPEARATSTPAPAADEPDAADEADEDADNSFSFESSATSTGGAFLPGPQLEEDRSYDWLRNGLPREVMSAFLADQVPNDRSIDFEWRTVPISDDESVTGPFPVGWAISEPFLGVEAEPVDDDSFDFFTSLELRAGCQGICAPQDWGAIMEDPETSPFTVQDSSAKLLIDQQLQPSGGAIGRLMVVSNPDDPFGAVEITVARWSDAASRFLWCQVGLGQEDVELWPAFADVCVAMVGDWF